MNEELYESFEAFLNNQMSSEERTKFEERLQSDEKFAMAFGEFQILVEAIQIGAEEHIKQEIAAIHEEENTTRTKVVKFQPRRFIAAAAVLLILIASGVVWQNNRSTSGAELYAEFVTQEKSPFTSRGSESMKDWQTFAEWLSKRDYNQALSELENSNLKPQYLSDFYRGYCMIKADKNLKDAIDILDEVRKTDNDYHAAAMWYQALAHVKLEQFDNAKDLLITIQSAHPKYREYEVEDLLLMLDK